MLIRSIAFLSLFLFSQACYAQEEQVSLQFVTFPKIANPEPVELLIGEGKTMKIILPTNVLSPVYKVKRLDKWALGKSSVGAEGEFVFNAYGKAASLASPKQLILVLRKGPKVSDGLELIVMDNRHSKFGGGMYFFMNAARVDIAVKIGDTKFAMKPLTRKLVQPKPSKVKGKRKYLYTYLHYRKEGKAVPYYESTWRYSEKARCMVFLYHDTHTKQLRTHTIRDYIQ